jgi:hypothetical protein
MSTKAIREFDGKRLISSYLTQELQFDLLALPQFVSIQIPSSASGADIVKSSIEDAIGKAASNCRLVFYISALNSIIFDTYTTV